MALTSAEIISIIQACHLNAVTKFTLGDLDVTFDGYRAPASQTSELARQLQEEQDWMTQLPPPPAPQEVE